MHLVQSFSLSLASRAIDAVIPALESALKRLDRWGGVCMRIAERTYRVER